MEAQPAFQSPVLPGLARVQVGQHHVNGAFSPRPVPSVFTTLAPCSTRPVCISSSQFAKPQSSTPAQAPPSAVPPIANIVLICGFETFNLSTYKAAANAVVNLGINATIITDVDLSKRGANVTSALRKADVVFCSLIFDYDQVEWLTSQLPTNASIFVFESALELMSCTRVGSFSMQNSSGKSSGMPDSIRFILRKLGLVGREEDKLAGYLALLKNAPRLLSLVPGRKARDLKDWLTVYSYWNAGGTNNVISMLNYITKDVLRRDVVTEIAPVVQIPNVGLLHPSCNGFFEHPRMYMDWYNETFPERKSWPVVAVLLYRKHVVSGLRYIPKLISWFEDAHLIPLPVFITGVEAHIIARDYLTSEFKDEARKRGDRVYGSFRRGKIASVDAVVSTIGYVLLNALQRFHSTISVCFYSNQRLFLLT